MRKQFIRFNIPTDNVKQLVEANHAFKEKSDINTIVEALEEACDEVEMKINDEVEGLAKQVIINDNIIVTLATCAEKMFERKNWGRVIVFISFLG